MQHEATDTTALTESDLAGLKQSELRKRAAADGATAEQLEEVDDSHAPRQAVVTLILSLQGLAS